MNGHIILISVLGFVVALTPTAAATKNWNNAAGGNWNTPGNWSPAGVPGAGDTVNLNLAGTYQVLLDVDATVSTLVVGGAAGTQTLSIESKNLTITTGATIANGDALSMTGGTITGPGAMTVQAGATLTFDDGQQKLLSRLVLLNQGTVLWKGGTLADGDFTTASIVTNSGLWLCQSDHQFGRFIGGAALMRFVNAPAGIVRKTAAAGSTFFNTLEFINAGLVDSQSGTLSFNNLLFALGGTFNAAATATITLASGSFTDAGGVFGGAGQNVMTGGTLTLRTNIHPALLLAGGVVKPQPPFQNAGAITNLTLSGATLANTNRLKGTLNVLATSALTDVLTIEPGATLTFDDGQQKLLSRLVLLNQGTVLWKGGTLADGDFTTASIVTNSGLWLCQSDHQFGRFIGGAALMRFVNAPAGIVRKTAAAGSTFFNTLEFINAGLVDSQSGTLSFNNLLFALGGTFNAAATATITLASGSFTDAGGVFGGAGQNVMTGGTLTLRTNIHPALLLAGGVVKPQPPFQNAGAITNLTLSGATLANTNRLKGTLNVLATSALTDVLTIEPGATLTFDDGQQKLLSRLVLLNQGTVLWKGGTLADGDFTTASIVTNSGLWLCQSDHQFGRFIGGAALMRFVNAPAGIVRKTAAAGSTFFNTLEFINAGLVDSQSGTLSFNNLLFALGGTFNAAATATITLASGSFTDAGGVFGGAGQNVMTGGTLTLRTNIHPALLLAGGVVKPQPPFQNAGAITNLTLSGATLANTNRLKGTLNVLATSALTDVLTIEPGATLTFDDGQQKLLSRLVLLNQGTVLWKGGTLADGDFTTASIVTNSGLWLCQSDHQFGRFIGGAALMRFVNAPAGIVRKTAAAGSTFFNTLEFINAGLVDSQSGTLSFNNLLFALGGTFNAAATATITLASGSFTDAGGVFGGAGQNVMTGGTLTLRTNIHPALLLAGGVVKPQPPFQNAGAITNLTLSGATLANTNRLKGTLNVLATSALTDVLTIEPGATLTFDDGQQKLLSRLVLLNQGTVLWKGGTLADGDFTTASIVTNSGLWLCQSDHQFGRFIGGAALMRFVNAPAGIVRKTAAAGSTFFNTLEFINAGLVEIQSGTLRLPVNATLAAGVLRPLDATLDSLATLTVSGGVLEGRGSVGANSFAGGTIRPGTNGGFGVILFPSGLNLTATATVSLNAGGLAPGTQQDQLKVTGAVNLNGATLQLTDIQNVPPGQVIMIIENDGADPVAGAFKNLPENTLITVGGASYRIQYAAGTGNDVTLAREGSATGIVLIPLQPLANGSYHFQGNGAALGTYKIEATVDFLSWANLGNVQANGAGLIDVIDPNAPSFPHRFYRAFGP